MAAGGGRLWVILRAKEVARRKTHPDPQVTTATGGSGMGAGRNVCMVLMEITD